MPQSNENSQGKPDSTSQTPAVPSLPAKQGKPSAENSTAELPEEKKLSLAELFAPAEEGDEDDGIPDDPSKAPESLEQLTKRLKLTDEQAYAVRIPMANAEPMTLGELKDKAAQVHGLELRELEFDQRRVRQEGELLRTQGEVRDLLSMIPREHLTPAIVERVRANHETHLSRERALTLEHIPSWHNEAARLDEIKGMNAMLSHWGFTEAFLPTVTDHRALKFIRDMYVRDKRINDALAKVKTPAKKPAIAPSGKPSKIPARPNANAEMRQKGPPETGSSKLAQLFKT